MQAATEDLGAAFGRLRRSLRSYLRRRLPDPAQADDLLQDVFVKALVAQRSGRHIGNLGGWLHAAARTTLADHYRARAAPMEPLDDDMPGGEDDDTRLHQELAQCLRPFIESLPTPYRDTLIANELQGQSLRSLALAQGLSVSAFKSRAARGRAMLRQRLLACCRVEWTNGLVADYRPVAARHCGCGGSA